MLDMFMHLHVREIQIEFMVVLMVDIRTSMKAQLLRDAAP